MAAEDETRTPEAAPTAEAPPAPPAEPELGPRRDALPKSARGRSAQSLQEGIYGTVLVISLIAVASEYRATDLEVIGSVAATVVVFWLAHVYAGMVAGRMALGHPVGWAGMKERMAENWPLIEAAFLPLAAVAIGALDIISEDDGVALALGVGILVLAGYGVSVARQERQGFWGIARTAVVNGAFGLVIVVLKVVVH
jgi:hypothetical protein